ncbi:MAG: chloride channel protein, partial [Ferrovum sp.]|nr:chloride channel protein [Ferrovum sp.]
MIKLGRGPWRSLRWRIRLTLWFFAALTGLLVAGFAKLADWALTLFFALESQGAWVPFLLAPAVGMVTVWLTQKYFPGI